jgi:hypothetical protein
MSDDFDELVVFSKEISEESKATWLAYFRREHKLKSLLSMVYFPSCGCECKVDYVIDRYPMSEIIISKCPVCDKFCKMEISNPPIFYLPILDKEYTLEEIKVMEV